MDVKNQPIKWSFLIISILIPLFVGRLSGLFSMQGSASYTALTRPPLSPPAILFPIVWTILYILMGISAYVIYTSACESKKTALLYYVLQLAANFLWPILFFNLKAYLTAFLWIILLWWLVLQMILAFWKCNKKAAYLQIPYLVWITFAAYLNLGIFFLNM